jgi:nanoRNase/pAp phosphatase (c-di-AMP/oligoRNAs hydrolase)
MTVFSISNMNRTSNREKIQKLLRVCHGQQQIAIISHDNPDPDSLASAWALSYLLRTKGISSRLLYSGVLGRTENRALVEALNIPLVRIETPRGAQPLPYALLVVDTQPVFGNNCLLPQDHILGVIDHHPSSTRHAFPFTDIRQGYGATGTILWEYLTSARIPIDPRLASALHYAIRTETMELGRETSEADKQAYLDLFPRMDYSILATILNAKRPASFFAAIGKAVKRARIHGPALVLPMGHIPTPEIVPETAETLLRLEGISWALSLGEHRGILYFSLRSTDPESNAGGLAIHMASGLGTAGGHDQTAGGKIVLSDFDAAKRKRIPTLLVRRFLNALMLPRKAHPLVPD